MRYAGYAEGGLEVDEYFAYEIDKYAIKTATHNFPMIKECGDVFKADFTQYEGIDYVVGGSPCTYWSIAQKNNRETEASGLGWDLFSQYVRAVREAKPKFFIYENNKSMSNAIKESISKEFGFEPICINSALVSAQNRNRLYWVGKRNPDGTYSKVDVKQPEDRGILLKDILDNGSDLTANDKSWTLTASYNGAVPWNTIERCQRNMVVEPVGVSQRGRYVESDSKSSKCKGNTEQFVEARTDGKSNCITTVQKDSMVAVPVNLTIDGKSQTIKAQYNNTSIDNICCYSSTYGATGVAEPVIYNTPHGFNNGGIKYDKSPTLTANGSWQSNNFISEPVRVGALPRPNGELSTSQAMRIYSTEGKSVNICAGSGGMGGKTGLYAIPVEYDGDKPTKAVSCADGKTYTVYEVKDGLITIKDKQYPIKLADGYYIIRKLTVSECKRLQTVPEWYEFPVSDTQAYKLCGNGWTVDVIAHLIEATLKENPNDS